MAIFTAKLFTYDFAKKAYMRTMEESALDTIRKAAREFYKAAVAAIPVRTGFSSGAFQNIVEAVGALGAPPAIPQTPAGSYLDLLKRLKHRELDLSRHPTTAGMFKFTSKDVIGARQDFRKYGGIPLEYYTGSGGRILKTPASGRQLATQPEHILTVHGFVFQFNFEIMIDYFNINDFMNNPRTPSAPWNSLKKGRDAFMEYLRTIGIKNLPYVQHFIVENTVEMGDTVKETKSEYFKRTKR